jgi:hypothetical protein
MLIAKLYGRQTLEGILRQSCLQQIDLKIASKGAILTITSESQIN